MKEPKQGCCYRIAGGDDGVRPIKAGTKIEVSEDENKTWTLNCTVLSSCREDEILLATGYKIGDTVHSLVDLKRTIKVGSKGTVTGLSLGGYEPLGGVLDGQIEISVRFDSGLTMDIRHAEISKTKPSAVVVYAAAIAFAAAATATFFAVAASAAASTTDSPLAASVEDIIPDHHNTTEFGSVGAGQ